MLIVRLSAQTSLLLVVVMWSEAHRARSDLAPRDGRTVVAVLMFAMLPFPSDARMMLLEEERRGEDRTIARPPRKELFPQFLFGPASWTKDDALRRILPFGLPKRAIDRSLLACALDMPPPLSPTPSLFSNLARRRRERIGSRLRERARARRLQT